MPRILLQLPPHLGHQKRCATACGSFWHYRGSSLEKFIRRYVVEDGEDKGEVEYILKHRKDHIYATICQFFDQDERRCTIYESRPSVCREYPDGKVCGYYNFLKFERKHQDDKEFIPSA